MDTTNLLTGGGGVLDNVSTGALFAGLWWGALGSGFALYGWKQKSMLPLGAGLVMLAVSYLFWNSTLYMTLASVLILAVFFWLKKQGY